MNLKPFRIYGEEEVINGLFALNATSGDKGSFRYLKKKSILSFRNILHVDRSGGRNII